MLFVKADTPYEGNEERERESACVSVFASSNNFVTEKLKRDFTGSAESIRIRISGVVKDSLLLVA